MLGHAALEVDKSFADEMTKLEIDKNIFSQKLAKNNNLSTV